jgi:putative ABC transport system permease protein
VLAEHGRVAAVDGEPEALARDIASGQIAVSDGFARHFGVGRGDSLWLDTPAGPRSFRVAGVIRDYAGPGGTLNIDLAIYDGLWSRPGARNVVIWADPPVKEVIRSIEQRTGQRQSLFFAYGAQLERYATRLLSRFTRIIDLMATLIAMLGGFAILNLLLQAVGERRRELGVLRSAGATRGQIAALVLIDGLIAGVMGGAAGIGLGIACAYPLATSVVPDVLGWSLEFSAGPGRLARLLIGIAIASLAAGIYPAWLSRRVLTREVLAPE